MPQGQHCELNFFLNCKSMNWPCDKNAHYCVSFMLLCFHSNDVVHVRIHRKTKWEEMKCFLTVKSFKWQQKVNKIHRFLELIMLPCSICVPVSLSLFFESHSYLFLFIFTKAAEWGVGVRARSCWLPWQPVSVALLGCECEWALASSASVCWVAVPLSPPEHHRQPWRTRGLQWWASQTHRTESTRPPLAESLCTWRWLAPLCRSGEEAAEGPALCLCLEGEAAGSGGPACAPWWARCAGSRASTAADRRCLLKSPGCLLACGWQRSGSCPRAGWWWRCRCNGPVSSPADRLRRHLAPQWSGCHSHHHCESRPEKPGVDLQWWPGTLSDLCSHDRTWRSLWSGKKKKAKQN